MTTRNPAPNVLTPDVVNVISSPTDHGKDLEAINRYISNTKANNYAANDLQRQWRIWFDTLSWYQRNFDDGVWLAGRKRRTEFNATNGTPEIPGGMTAEQMQPQDESSATASAYNANEASKKLNNFLEQLKAYAKATGVVAGVGVGGILLLKLLRLRK